MSNEFNEDHFNHDPKWTYSIDQNVTCMACIISMLQNDQISYIQKTASMSLLSKVIQIPDVLQDLKSTPNIACHIVRTTLDVLLYRNDASFISSATEVFFRLTQKMESEEFVDFILQDIASTIEQINSHMDLLPLYILIGRLVQKYPGISNKFLHNYEPVITKLCTGLCCPEEDVQSAIMFILVYLFQEQWEDCLSPRQLTQLCEDLVCILNTAKTQILLMNSLGLLTKLLFSDAWLQFLMTMTVSGLTLLSVLKKAIASTVEDVQQLAIQILSCIVQRDDRKEYSFHILQSDLVEFLFEKLNTRNTQNIENIFKSLLPLSQQDQFYARNHSVYGIEVLLKTLYTVMKMNHYNLTKKVLEILSIVFDRQPTNSPLFVNSTTVKYCMDVILSVIDHNHPGVFLAGLKVTKMFLRKDHMLRPVPVSDIKMILEKMTEKVQTIVQGTEMFEKQKSGNKVSLISCAYCEAMMSTSKLVLDCQKDPSTCLSAFLAPDVVDNKGSTIESLTEMVVNIISHSALCFAVNLLDNTDIPEHCSLLFQLLNNLQKLDQKEHRKTLLQLTQGGLLSKAISVRCCLGNSHADLQQVDPCLMAWCLLLYEEENKDSSSPGELEFSINSVTVRLEDLASYLIHSTMNKGTVYMYSFLLYHCYRNDHLVLPFDELMFVLDAFSVEYNKPAELSPLVRKQFIFLWAMVTYITENVVDLPEKGLQTILCLVRSCPSSLWYTHHPAMLHWPFKDSRFTKICGQDILLHWLYEVCTRESDNDPDVTTLYHMFSDVDFMSVVVTSLANMSRRTGKFTVDLVDNYLIQLTDSDDKGMFLLSLTAVTEERLVEIFLQPNQKPEDMNIELYIQLLMMCGDTNTDDISSSFLKILYHITSWLDEDKDESTVISCLHLLGRTMYHSPARVVSLIVNSYKFMSLFNSLLKTTREELYNVSWNVLSQIIINTKGLNEKESRQKPEDDTIYECLVKKYLDNHELAGPALQCIPRTVELISKNKDNFVFFFKKESPFSQFHLIKFEVDGQIYNCAEQYMMHQKAVLFNDKKNGTCIMAELKPWNQKLLGRHVQGFNSEIWDRESKKIVRKGNIAKFKQNPTLEEQLFKTYPKILAESSPRDCVWGIGLGEDSEDAWNIGTWRGKNLLGFILMEVRYHLMQEKGKLD